MLYLIQSTCSLSHFDHIALHHHYSLTWCLEMLARAFPRSLNAALIACASKNNFHFAVQLARLSVIYEDDATIFLGENDFLWWARPKRHASFRRAHKSLNRSIIRRAAKCKASRAAYEVTKHIDWEYLSMVTRGWDWLNRWKIFQVLYKFFEMLTLTSQIQKLFWTILKV